jgi:hypothetical protein
MAMKTEEGPGARNAVASRTGNGSSPELPKKDNPDDASILSQWVQVWTSVLQNFKVTTFCCFKTLSLCCFAVAAIGLSPPAKRRNAELDLRVFCHSMGQVHLT